MPRTAKPSIPLEDFLEQPLHPQAAEDAAFDRETRQAPIDNYDPYAIPSRSTREATSRENDARPGTSRSSEILPSPPRKPGVRYRWVAIAVLGSQEQATVNAARRWRDGWRPVDTATLTEDYLASLGYSRPKAGDRIEIGGLVLCEINEHDARAIDAELADKNRAFLGREAEDRRAFKKSAHASMPTFDEREFILRDDRPE